MSKRARYVGPHLEVVVFDSEAGVYAPPVAVVEHNKWLPDDVPARIRDELLQSPDWAEVNQADTKAADDTKGGE